MGMYIDENPRLLNALVTSSLRFSNNTELHHLVHSYLELVNTAESHRLGKLLEQPVSNRVRRSSTSDWDASNSVYNLVSSLSSRRNDVTFYPTQKAYLWGTTFGPSNVNIQAAAGTFGGFRDRRNFKVFAKAAAKVQTLPRNNSCTNANSTEQEAVGMGRPKTQTLRLCNQRTKRYELANCSSCTITA